MVKSPNWVIISPENKFWAGKWTENRNKAWKFTLNLALSTAKDVAKTTNKPVIAVKNLGLKTEKKIIVKN